ncbi:Plasma membrane fusion protein prm1 [Penicillium longicatenatum]|uniref:Plasma membrane fusion protein prm1 n=1 Tax=Penicillium longicatenatum TaxID=1561947 RepID=UPI002547D801|nr:Plasma membrane fusion protein prm1 [Penicillium longicatenatum]KAJ5631382.1 Plasma membrane fusion protein prm1 [Penicillium longicatenatum]
MVFGKSTRTIFPLLPPYGAHNPEDGRIIPSHPDGLTPYLGLRARLSQVWINRWTILILLVLVRLLLAIGNIRSDMASAKREALSACTSVESMGSAMASMPHYLAGGVNELTAAGVTNAVSGLNSMLDLVITAAEEIIIFVLKMMYQTYLCLITLAVRGVVEAATVLIEDVIDGVNKTIKAVESDITSVVGTFETALNDVTSLINDLGASIPTLNLNSSLAELNDWSIPSSVDTSISKLNNSIPSFATVENFTEYVIKSPFEEVKKLLNDHLGNYSFDSSVLSIPAKKSLTFCNDNDGINSFFDGVTDVAITARKIFIIVCIVAAVLACIPSAYQEIRRWRQMKERAQLVRKEAHDPMDVVYIVSRPYTAAAGIKAASRFSNSRRQIIVRWAIAYATTMPALFVLALAIASLLACLFQWIILHEISKEVPALSAEVGQYADKVVSALQNASTEWADDANGYITNFDNEINTNVLGWVNTTTTAVNDTLNVFVEKVTGVLNDTFGDTILKDPIEEVFNCLIGLKIASFEKGLTWVSDNAHVNFPLFPDDVFSKGANESITNDSSDDSFLSNAGDETSNKITEVVNEVIHALNEALRLETIIATGIFLIWVIIVMMGVFRAMFLWWGRDRNRGDGGGHAMDPVPNNPQLPPGPRGFTDVPLTAMPKAASGGAPPAPRYEASAARAVAVQNDPFHDAHAYPDEKLGFAGQRTLQVDSTATLRQSNCVEYDVKG